MVLNFKIKMNKKNIINAALSLVLLVSLLFTSVFCFLQISESITNVVTIGDIDIKLVEDGWEKVTNTADANYGSYVRTDGTSFNTTPDDIIEKAPYVVNTGINDVRAFLIVKVPTVTEKEFYNSNIYLNKYGNKYDIKVSALGIQNGMFKDEDGNTTSDAKTIWDVYMGKSNSFFNEPQANEEREELVNINGLDIGDEGTWSEAAVFKGESHNFYVYGYNEVVRGLRYYERQLAALDPDTEQDEINETTALIESGEYGKTTQLFQSFKLKDGFGSGPNITAKPLPLGGALFYVDTVPKTYTNREGDTITINPGEDENGRPYRYTFYDKTGEALSDEEVIDVNISKVANHKITGYTIEIPEYYETALENGDITQEEYDAVPKNPVWDKYYVVAAQDNANRDTYTMYYGHTDLTKGAGEGEGKQFTLSRTAISPAYYPLDIHVKEFLIENNLVDRYYDVSGDTWALKTNGDAAYNSNKLFGMGKYNTKFIYEMYGTSNTSLFASTTVYNLLEVFNNDTAARRNKTGCYDWYIPSINEMALIQTIYRSSTSKFSYSGSTWSSSEQKNGTTASYIYYNSSSSNDGANSNCKHRTIFVRSF